MYKTFESKPPIVLLVSEIHRLTIDVPMSLMVAFVCDSAIGK